MRAFVTGAGGFVGHHLVPRLERQGFEVEATDLELDVSDASAVEAAFARSKPDVVVHLAAVTSVPASRRDPHLTYRVNYLGAHSVLEAALRSAPQARILLVGSSEMYGFTEPGAPPFTEKSPLRPESPYARTKAAADLLGGVYAAQGLDVVRVRPFNHTGAGQSEAFVLASFAKQAVEIALGRREPTLRVGNLDSVRDFLDVHDVVDAYARLGDSGPGDVPSGVYNVATGVGVRIGDALGTILHIAGVSPQIEPDPARVRPTDHTVGDSERLRRATGWMPQVPFDDTLARVVEDWRKRLSAA